MERDQPPSQLPEVGEVVQRHGHSGGVRVPGSVGPRGGPQDAPRASGSGGTGTSSTGPAGPDPHRSAVDTVSKKARPRLGRLGLLPVLLLVGGGLWLGNGDYSSTSDTVNAAPKNLHMQVEGASDVRIRSVPGAALTMRSSSTFPGNCVLPAVRADEPSGTITCTGSWVGGSAVELDVPTGTHLTLDSGNADVRATGTMAGLSVTTDRGDVEFEKLTADMGVRTQRGDVRLADVAGRVWVQTGNGDVRGEVRSAPAVTVRSSGGDVKLTYDEDVASTLIETPDDVDLGLKGTVAELDLFGAGDVASSVNNVPGSPQKVSIKSGADIDLSAG
ncbi:MAG: DUF4097 family beta strand repeat-containing protein [Micrococcales bacterium]|nr:DUF4097 family beta strand repeat-containing protein [Micrococcales bacterium]